MGLLSSSVGSVKAETLDFMFAYYPQSICRFPINTDDNVDGKFSI